MYKNLHLSANALRWRSIIFDEHGILRGVGWQKFFSTEFVPSGGRRTNLFFLHQIAALIVGIAVVIDAGELLLIAAHMLAHHLVEVVVLVGILFALSGTALLQQVAKLHRLDVYIFIYIFSLFERMQ